MNLLVSWPLNKCFSYASTPFTSEIAIIGRKRANSRNSVRNNPKVPDERAHVHPGRMEIAPRAGQKIAMSDWWR